MYNSERGTTSKQRFREERRIFMGYGISVLIFCLGVCISAGLVGYVIHGNRKYKITAPGKDEEET